jgi:hypothetical protein
VTLFLGAAQEVSMFETTVEESGARLKRKALRSSLAHPREGLREIAVQAKEKLGYTALAERLDGEEANRMPERRLAEAMSGIAGPGILTELSIKRYKKRVRRSSNVRSLLGGTVAICFIALIASPHLLMAVRRRTATQTDELQRSEFQRAWPLLLLSAIVQAVLITGVLNFGLFGSPKLSVAWAGIVGLLSLAARWFTPRALMEWIAPWLTTLVGEGAVTWKLLWLQDFRGHVPERVLENAIALKEQLQAQDVAIKFIVDVAEPHLSTFWKVDFDGPARRAETVHKRALAAEADRLRAIHSQIRRWANDSFLVVELGGKRFYIDYWDEKAFVPEYAD